MSNDMFCGLCLSLPELSHLGNVIIQRVIIVFTWNNVIIRLYDQCFW